MSTVQNKFLIFLIVLCYIPVLFLGLFDVDEGATKAKIKSAFIKSLKTKKLNKTVLGEFISLVV